MESGIDPGQEYYTQDYYNYDHGFVCPPSGPFPAILTCHFLSTKGVCAYLLVCNLNILYVIYLLLYFYTFSKLNL